MMNRSSVLRAAVVTALMCSMSAMAVDLAISSITPSGYTAQYNSLAVGQEVYTDRSFTFTNVASLGGSTYIKTANDDKQSTGSSFLTFTIDRNCTVYVAHDDTVTPKPAWLGEFVDTTANLVTNDNGKSLSLYARDFPAGLVTLGGNRVDYSPSISMYSVVVVPLPTAPPEIAFNPAPANNAGNVPLSTTLSWSAGQHAVSHDVYFGTSEASVRDALRLVGDIDGDGSVNISDLAILAAQWLTNPGAVNPSADIEYSQKVDMDDFAALAFDWHQESDAAFKGNQPGTVYALGTLTSNTTYWWRIDEVNASHPDSPWEGPVWSFTTESATAPAAATNPSPGNGANGIAISGVTLSWTAGAGATSHDVYFGNSSPGTYRGNQTATTYATGALTANATYYWRINEVNSYGTTTGTVWTFTTEDGSVNTSYSYYDTWVAVDALGRALPDHSQAGSPRAGKSVAMFYSLWLGEHGTGGPYDITKILAANPTSPNYGPGGEYPNGGAPHHWGESELGYYLSSDQWVMRKHAYLLANAGVDVIIFDITNAYQYKNNYMALCSVFANIRANGGTTPQIAFFAYAFADQSVQGIYNDLYSKNLYSDLWFYWKGKPLVLAPLDGMNILGRDIYYSTAVKNFFNMRYTWWKTGGAGTQYTWNWLDDYPQKYGTGESSSIPEAVSVSAGHHANSNQGRSFLNGSQPSYNQYKLTGYEHLGRCFGQQWSRLNQIDPELVFITQWNEWTQERYIVPAGQQFWFLGQLVGPGGTFFVDSFNQEYSRDIEPMKGGHTDNYYYQMIDGIRKYKGVRQLPAPSAAKTISVDGNFADWISVGPEYVDAKHDTMHRNSTGWGSAGTYVNTTGRNDFTGAKVARDDTYVYFYIRTDANISSYTGSNWMLLFINADRNYTNGWHGYNYLVNLNVNSSTSTTLKHTSGGWNWTTVNSNIAYRVSGNQMELRIPRSDIGQGSGSDRVAFDFKWADNIQAHNDILQFSISGDSAPDRRFNYRYDTAITNTIVITNPSFETPSVSNFQYDPSGSGWNFSPAGQFAIAKSGSAFGNTAYQGSQVMVMQREVAVWQAVSGFQPGKTYRVTWAEASRSGELGGNTLRVLIDSNVVKDLRTITNTSWTVQNSNTFTATATTHTLRFDATNAQGGDRSVFVDAVSITEVP